MGEQTVSGQLEASALFGVLRKFWLPLCVVPLLAGILALAASYLIRPAYTARTSFLPPQQAQSAASSLLSNLGSLGGLAGTAAGMRSPIDQYVTLLQTAFVSDRIVDAFELMQIYDVKLRVEARESLLQKVQISAGRKDGVITVEVEDHEPKRAAAIANRYVEELRLMTSKLSLTEAQQRRAFFDVQLAKTRESLAAAQNALQASGFTAGSLSVEPRASAERYARLQAEVSAAEVKVQAMRAVLVDTAPELQSQLSLLAALRAQLARAEAPRERGGSDYVSKYREFKYHETLFELYARQLEMARLDEGREGSLVQVLDTATVPERKSKPKRSAIGAAAAVAAFVLMLLFLVARDQRRAAVVGSPQT
jgi:uncharacterized protein involved in exopolysaccharide biosynthesis